MKPIYEARKAERRARWALAIDDHEGCVAKAAEAMGMSHASGYREIRTLGLRETVDAARAVRRAKRPTPDVLSVLTHKPLRAVQIAAALRCELASAAKALKIAVKTGNVIKEGAKRATTYRLRG